MTMNTDRSDARLLWEAAREAEPTPIEVTAVMTRATAPQRARVRRRGPAILGVVVVTAFGGYAVPATRAGIQDALHAFAGYFGGGSNDAPRSTDPGRELRPADDAPAWVRNPPAAGQRVLASNGGFELYLLREPGGGIAFQLDRSVGFSDTPDGWAARLRDNALVVLGTGGADSAGVSTDARGRVPVYGVVARPVARVELVYASGTSVDADASGGGFVLLAHPHLRPRAVVARGRGGEELQRVAVQVP